MNILLSGLVFLSCKVLTAVFLHFSLFCITKVLNAMAAYDLLRPVLLPMECHKNGLKIA